LELIIRQRKSIRLKEYDYSQPGEYFVTICTYNHECLLGEIVNGEMQLSQMGAIVSQCLVETPKYFPNVELDEFVVMPNHVHAIIVITERRDLINQIPIKPKVTNEIPSNPDVMNHVPTEWMMMKNPKQVLGKIIRNFKACAAKGNHDAGFLNFRWQSKYYDRIIRDEKELNNIRDYIANNVFQWSLDKDNPDNIPL
jgi:putative transposase